MEKLGPLNISDPKNGSMSGPLDRNTYAAYLMNPDMGQTWADLGPQTFSEE